MRFYAWWNGMPRQGRTGWTLVVVGVVYVLYFIKARLLETGPAITGKEWFYFAAMIVCLMIGTANIRLAAMRDRRKLDQTNKTSA